MIMLNNLLQMHLKFLQKSNSTCSKIANKIAEISKTSQQNNSEAVTNEHGEEIPNDRYISSEEEQKTIND